MKKIVLFIILTLSLPSHWLFSIAKQYPTKDLLEGLSAGSLNRYAFSVYSQNGEDGILEEVFRRIGIQKGFFIEFGAADGIWLSNSRFLWEKGWSGVMIEANQAAYRKLLINYKKIKNVQCLNYFVSTKPYQPDLTLDQIAVRHFPDQEIDFLSIDIDGADSEILEGLLMRPKVICVETNLSWHPLFKQRIPSEVSHQNLHQPLPVMMDIANKMGYKPVAMTINLILVRNDYAHLFPEVPSDALTLWRDGFRGKIDKDYNISLRKNNPFIKKHEPPELQQTMPITKDF